MIDTEFTEFVADRQRPLLRFATALSGDPRLAEEMVADTLSKAWEHWDRIAAMDHPNSYIRKMVVSEFLSWRRRLRRTSVVAELADFADLTSDPAADHDDRRAIIARLATLPRKQRAALVLRYDEGMSDAEIAHLLGCSAGTVRSNISRALATLRIQLQAGEAIDERPPAAARPDARSARPDIADVRARHAPFQRPPHRPLPVDTKGHL